MSGENFIEDLGDFVFGHFYIKVAEEFGELSDVKLMSVFEPLFERLVDVFSDALTAVD